MEGFVGVLSKQDLIMKNDGITHEGLFVYEKIEGSGETPILKQFPIRRNMRFKEK